MAGKVRLRGVKGKRWKRGQSSSSNPDTKKHRLAAKGKFGNHLAQANSIEKPTVELTKDALASHNANQGEEDIDLASKSFSDTAVEGEKVRAEENDNDDDDDDDDASSIAMTTTSSAYSLIETAHPVFGKVKKLWNSPLESHREICAVLAAVSDVIKMKGGGDTVTEYFGTLVTALESAEDEKSCMAISFLLHLAMSKTPVEVLQSGYSSICKIISEKLSAYEVSDSVGLLKPLVASLFVLLGAQQASVWSEGYTQRVFQLLLNYTIHPKPKLRKAAQMGVVSLLREGTVSGSFHYAAGATATHCLHMLEKGDSETSALHLLGMLKDCLANLRPTDVQKLCEQILKLVSMGNSVVRTTAFRALHGMFSSVAGPQGLTLQLNARLLAALYDYQPSYVDVQLLNAWLVVMEAGHQRLLNLDLNLGVTHLPKLFSCTVDSFMTTASFVKQTAASLLENILKRLNGPLSEFVHKVDQSQAPPTLPEAFSISVPSDRSNCEENLFQVLVPYRKPFAVALLGEEEGLAKLEAMENALDDCKMGEEVCCSLFQTWLGGCGRGPVTWGTFAEVLKEVELPSLAKAVKKMQKKGVASIAKEGAGSSILACVERMFRAVEVGLKYKFLSSWKYVLRVLGTFYEVAGRHETCVNFMTKSLVFLSELRASPNFPCSSELDGAFGAAVGTLGPRVVLSAVPLDLGSESLSGKFPRSWILPVLKDRVRKTELAYFTERLLPLAAKLRAAGVACSRSGRATEAKLYATLQFQVWSLFPSFCTDATDIGRSFRPLARILGTALKDIPELRCFVYRGLNLLITTATANDEVKSVLVCFSKNFLPILFNLYTTPTKEGEELVESKDKQSLLLECMKAYISITDQGLVDTFFGRLMAKLKDDSNSSFHPRLLDVAGALSPRLLQPSLMSLLQLISPLLDSGNSNLQKKSYSCLEAILSGTTPDHCSFLKDNLGGFRKVLVDSLSTATIASKKPRLRCLLHIVENLSGECEDFVTSILPELILSTKEVNEKARSLAYRLVLDIGRSSQSFLGGSAEESMVKYFSLVLAGLAGSPRMASCTLLSLSKLVFEFHDILGTDLVRDIFSGCLSFLSSSHREVVRAALALIRVAVGILPVQELHPHAETLVKKILSWGENKRSHFRLKYRALLERLVRRLGHELVASFVPKQHQKLMAHIRKMADRQRRRKLERQRQQFARKEDEARRGRRERASYKPSYEELLQSSDEEEDGEGEWLGKKEKGHLYWRNRSRDVSNGNHKAKKEEGKAWIQEGPEDEPVNFMDPVVSKKVVATDPAKIKVSKNPSKSREVFKTDSHGRMIIEEELDAMAGGLSEQLKELDGVGKKRQRNDENEEEDQSAYGSGGCGIHRRNAKKEDFKAYGTEYRAKRAKGDVKKKGAPDPYAYIPLNRQKLNKRKKAKLTGQFKNMVGKAVRGSATGTKKRCKK